MSDIKISSIKISNFKFFIEEDINLNNKNVVVYGENGSGKSSFREAISAFFSFDNLDEQKNRFTGVTPAIKLTFSDGSTFSNNDTMPSFITNSERFFIYHNLLSQVISESDLLISVQKHLKDKFNFLDSFFLRLDTLKEKIHNYSIIGEHDDVSQKTLIEEKNVLLEELDTKLTQLFEQVKSVLEGFDEPHKVSFQIDNSDIEFGLTPSETKPYNIKVKILIDDLDNIISNNNEATIKATSLAFYLALINLHHDNTTQMKLMVFDDFLLSLDMAHRKYVIEYILRSYPNFQKIILTHDLTFFKNIRSVITVLDNDPLKNWKYFNIFSRKNTSYCEPKLYDFNSTDNYLEMAKTAYTNNELEKAANLLRKEAEKLLSQLKIKLQVGKKDMLHALIQQFKVNQHYYEDPHKLLKEIHDTATGTEKDRLDESLLEPEMLKNIFSVDLDRAILLNLGSHANTDETIYRKEIQGAINTLKKLKEHERLKL